jgi:hypothetical protein
MIVIEGVSAALMTVLAVALLRSFGLVGCAMGFAFGQGLYALLLILVARRRSGVWISWTTLGWAALCVGICLAAQVFASQRPSGAWALLPVVLSGVTAGVLYFRLLRRP